MNAIEIFDAMIKEDLVSDFEPDIGFWNWAMRNDGIECFAEQWKQKSVQSGGITLMEARAAIKTLGKAIDEFLNLERHPDLEDEFNGFLENLDHNQREIFDDLFSHVVNTIWPYWQEIRFSISRI